MSYAYDAVNLGLFLLGGYLLLRGTLLYYKSYREQKKMRRDRLGDFAGHDEWKAGNPNEAVPPHATPIKPEFLSQRIAR